MGLRTSPALAKLPGSGPGRVYKFKKDGLRSGAGLYVFRYRGQGLGRVGFDYNFTGASSGAGDKQGFINVRGITTVRINKLCWVFQKTTLDARGNDKKVDLWKPATPNTLLWLIALTFFLLKTHIIFRMSYKFLGCGILVLRSSINI